MRSCTNLLRNSRTLQSTISQKAKLTNECWPIPPQTIPKSKLFPPSDHGKILTKMPMSGSKERCLTCMVLKTLCQDVTRFKICKLNLKPRRRTKQLNSKKCLLARQLLRASSSPKARSIRTSCRTNQRSSSLLTTSRTTESWSCSSRFTKAIWLLTSSERTRSGSIWRCLTTSPSVRSPTLTCLPLCTTVYSRLETKSEQTTLGFRKRSQSSLGLKNTKHATERSSTTSS